MKKKAAPKKSRREEVSPTWVQYWLEDRDELSLSFDTYSSRIAQEVEGFLFLYGDQVEDLFSHGVKETDILHLMGEEYPKLSEDDDGGRHFIASLISHDRWKKMKLRGPALFRVKIQAAIHRRAIEQGDSGLLRHLSISVLGNLEGMDSASGAGPEGSGEPPSTEVIFEVLDGRKSED